MNQSKILTSSLIIFSFLIIWGGVQQFNHTNQRWILFALAVGKRDSMNKVEVVESTMQKIPCESIRFVLSEDSVLDSKLEDVVERLKLELKKDTPCFDVIRIVGRASSNLNMKNGTLSEEKNFEVSISRAKEILYYLYNKKKLPLECMVLQADGWMYSKSIKQFYHINPGVCFDDWYRKEKTSSDLLKLYKERQVIIEGFRSNSNLCAERLKLEDVGACKAI